MTESKLSNIVLQIFNAALPRNIRNAQGDIARNVYSHVPNHFVRVYRDVDVKPVDSGHIL
jgi:hypothetical protein